MENNLGQLLKDKLDQKVTNVTISCPKSFWIDNYIVEAIRNMTHNKVAAIKLLRSHNHAHAGDMSLVEAKNIVEKLFGKSDYDLSN